MITLNDNLRLAKDAIQFVKACLPYDAANINFAWPTSTLRVCCRRLFLSYIASLFKKIITVSQEERFILEACISMIFKAGNCSEQSVLAFNYLNVLKIKNVELIRLYSDDHRFLLIGRNKNSSLKDQRNWGSSAVICDPWAGKCYPAHQLIQEMNALLNTNYVRTADFKMVLFYSEKQENSIYNTIPDPIEHIYQDAKIKKQYINTAMDSYLLLLFTLALFEYQYPKNPIYSALLAKTMICLCNVIVVTRALNYMETKGFFFSCKEKDQPMNKLDDALLDPHPVIT